MNVGARSETTGPAAGDAGGGGPAASPPDAAGRLLARLSVLPALPHDLYTLVFRSAP